MEDKPTTIIIAHRLSTVKRADVVLVVKDGQVVETLVGLKKEQEIVDVINKWK
jgi:ABC-type transport system involved in Fe-S cluster assembly fused permease/ATPase subunit